MLVAARESPAGRFCRAGGAQSGSVRLGASPLGRAGRAGVVRLPSGPRNAKERRSGGPRRFESRLAHSLGTVSDPT